MTVQQIQDYVYQFFIGKGLPAITVCAIMGNIQGENAGWVITQEELSGGGGFGLCQWTNTAGSPRRTQLENYGTDLQSQCEFLWSELTGEYLSETGASYQWIANPHDSVDNGEGFYCDNADFLAGNGSIEFLTKAFCYCWERPAYATNHLTTTRIPYAIKFYEYYTGDDYEGGEGGDVEPPTPPPTPSGSIYEQITQTPYKTNQLTNSEIALLQSLSLNDECVVKHSFRKNKRYYGKTFFGSKVRVDNRTFKIINVENNGFLRLQYATSKYTITINPKYIAKE